MASYGRPAQAIATRRPDPSRLLGGPACRSPGIRCQQASQGHINGFLLASNLFLGGPACRSPGIRSQQASQGHINAFAGRSSLPFARDSPPTGIPRSHQWLLMGVQACRLPALKPLKPSKPLKRLKPLKLSKLPKRLGPDPLLFLGGPACRSPGIRSQQASQGHINSFFCASKLAVCQPLNP